MDKVREVLKKQLLNYKQLLQTGPLNRFIDKITQASPLTLKNSKGRKLKVKYASMVKKSPPTILLFSNMTRGIPTSYRKYLEKNLRKEFNLNTPIRLVFRTGG